MDQSTNANGVMHDIEYITLIENMRAGPAVEYQVEKAAFRRGHRAGIQIEYRRAMPFANIVGHVFKTRTRQYLPQPGAVDSTVFRMIGRASGDHLGIGSQIGVVPNIVEPTNDPDHL